MPSAIRLGSMKCSPRPSEPRERPPLPQSLRLSRALRPLRRSIPAVRARVLDLDATVEQFSDRGLWLPVMRARREPWLELDLLVDGASSMVIWQPAVRALLQLLRRQDAFTRVRELRLLWPAGGGVIEADASGHRLRGSLPISNRQRRRLLWVLTDGVAPGWDGAGPLAALLRQHAQRGPVALVQMLPQHMWAHTAFGAMRQVSLSAAAPARPNRFLRADLDRWPPGALRLPVLTLDPHALRTWAALIDGHPDIWCAGFAFSAAPDRPAESAADPAWHVSPLAASTDAERLTAFQDHASPEARQLARAFAVLPLNLLHACVAQHVLTDGTGRLTHLAGGFSWRTPQTYRHTAALGPA